MHLFFDTVWKLHIGEMPEKPRLCDSYIGPCVKWTGRCSCEVLSKEYNAKIAAIKQNALTVGNPDIRLEIFGGMEIGFIDGIAFYKWPGNYEMKEIREPIVSDYDLSSGRVPMGSRILKSQTVAILTLPEEKTSNILIMKAKYLITIFIDENQEYRWHAKRNGRIVAESGEGYKGKAALKKTLGNLIEAMGKNDFMING